MSVSRCVRALTLDICILVFKCPAAPSLGSLREGRAGGRKLMRLALNTALGAHARELVSSTQPWKSTRRGASLGGDQTICKTDSDT